MATAARSVDEYLAAIDPERRRDVEALLALVREELPGARETMHYKMPTFETEGPLVAVGAQKRHLALYVCEAPALERHRARFAHLDVGKGCIRFEALADLPLGHVRAMLREL